MLGADGFPCWCSERPLLGRERTLLGACDGDRCRSRVGVTERCPRLLLLL